MRVSAASAVSLLVLGQAVLGEEGDRGNLRKLQEAEEDPEGTPSHSCEVCPKIPGDANPCEATYDGFFSHCTFDDWYVKCKLFKCFELKCDEGQVWDRTTDMCIDHPGYGTPYYPDPGHDGGNPGYGSDPYPDPGYGGDPHYPDPGYGGNPGYDSDPYHPDPGYGGGNPGGDWGPYPDPGGNPGYGGDPYYPDPGYGGNPGYGSDPYHPDPGYGGGNPGYGNNPYPDPGYGDGNPGYGSNPYNPDPGYGGGSPGYGSDPYHPDPGYGGGNPGYGSDPYHPDPGYGGNDPGYPYTPPDAPGWEYVPNCGEGLWDRRQTRCYCEDGRKQFNPFWKTCDEYNNSDPSKGGSQPDYGGGGTPRKDCGYDAFWDDGRGACVCNEGGKAWNPFTKTCKDPYPDPGYEDPGYGSDDYEGGAEP